MLDFRHLYARRLAYHDDYYRLIIEYTRYIAVSFSGHVGSSQPRYYEAGSRYVMNNDIFARVSFAEEITRFLSPQYQFTNW